MTVKAGDVVMHRTQVPDRQHNGTKDHPAFVTRVWSQECLNLKIIPDCGPVRDETSVSRIDPTEEGQQGWYTE